MVDRIMNRHQLESLVETQYFNPCSPTLGQTNFLIVYFVLKLQKNENNLVVYVEGQSTMMLGSGRPKC